MVEFETPLILEPEPDIKINIDLSLYLTQTRDKRNTYLNNTDKYLLSDYPITPENLEIIKNYRQMLREFINTNKDLILTGEKIEIPSIPQF